jgi:uncharacterized protein (DUF2141 family)
MPNEGYGFSNNVVGNCETSSWAYKFPSIHRINATLSLIVSCSPLTIKLAG